MPDDGADGSYSDWYGSVIGTGERAPAWETYHVKELIPFIDATFPTAADRSHRFIAGLSSGGHGAMKYAAIYPQLFGAAGEFSGAVDTTISYPSTRPSARSCGPQRSTTARSATAPGATSSPSRSSGRTTTRPTWRRTCAASPCT